MILFFLDTETTALDPKDGELLEVGTLLYDTHSREIIYEASYLLPYRDPRGTAGAILMNATLLKECAQSHRNGIDLDQMKEDIVMQMLEDIPAYGMDHTYLCGKNIPFDLLWLKKLGSQKLNRLLAGMPKIDLDEFCRDFSRPRPHSLATVAKALGIEQEQSHRALDDCKLELTVMRKLTNDFTFSPVDAFLIKQRLKKTEDHAGGTTVSTEGKEEAKA